MEIIKFKTNINCGGCIEKVTPYINEEANIKSWEVDTTNPQKVLTIETENLSADRVILLLSKAGFKAEKL